MPRQHLHTRNSSGDTAYSGPELSMIRHDLEEHRAELQAESEALREAQSDLEASRNEYADLYDNAPCGYLLLDAAGGTVHKLNVTAARMLGGSPQGLEGALLRSHVAPGEEVSLTRHLMRCKRAPVSSTVTTDLRLNGDPPGIVQLTSTTAQRAEAAADPSTRPCLWMLPRPGSSTISSRRSWRGAKRPKKRFAPSMRPWKHTSKSAPGSWSRRTGISNGQTGNSIPSAIRSRMTSRRPCAR